jgi:ornithine carbamoyltransferase
MVDAVMIRANVHDDVVRFAQASSVPVINGLTDDLHPCQGLTDYFTLMEVFGGLDALRGRKLAYVGDGNNVCHSFMHAAPKFGFRLNVACPADYHPNLHDLARGGDHVRLTSDPREAVAGADVVVTDTWVSMGDQDYEARLEAFEGYGVDDALMEAAAPDAVFLHCLPAHRGEEVTDAVIDGPRSLVWDEAENRIHVQKAVLAWCFGGKE